MIPSVSRPRRIAALTVLVAVLAATTGTATAATARPRVDRPTRRGPAGDHALAAATIASARPVAGGIQQVELALTPRDRAGLAALATTHGLTRATRLSRLDGLLPGSTRAAETAAAVRRLGLTVTGRSALTLSASGPAAMIASLFGTEQATGLPTAQALPRVPAALHGLVTVAYGGDDTRPAELPLGETAADEPGRAALTIGQSRSLYGTAASTSTPTTSAPIVATLQFTTQAVITEAIRNDDSFASTNHLYATPGYQPSTNIAQEAVSEPGSSCSPMAGAGDGVEVALDTQTLLAVAPQLRQRVYQADNNCADAQGNAIAQIVSDVQGGAPIVALSTSWGSCEEGTYGTSDKADNAQAESDIDDVNALLAAGVTMFAATGDSGAFDCFDDEGNAIFSDAVDTPAAVPGVVAVGGTTGTSSAALTTWNDGASGATGGGFSCGYFARPSYQSAVAESASYPHNDDDYDFGCDPGTSERMLPDIAENGGNGLITVATVPGCAGCTYRVFGTSFAAPLAAGGFAETLVGDGVTAGIGDIHSLLYGSSGTGAAGLTDVTRGNIEDYTAGSGYDLTTGLGTPIWPVLLSTKSTSTARDGLPVLSGYNPPSLAYDATAVVTGYADPGTSVQVYFHIYGQDGYDVRRTLTASSTGSFSFSYVAVSDERYYVVAGGKASASELTEVAPGVSGPASQVVKTGSTVTIRGHSTSGTYVDVHFHAAGTPAGDYSIVRQVAVASADGPFTRPFTANKSYRYYVTGTNGLASPSFLVQAD